MRIDAITSCVGEGYVRRFLRALPIWLDTLDSITVVCSASDCKLESVQHSNFKIVTSDVFNSYTAHFNKGAALCYAYGASLPQDWALHFDADVFPDKNWRRNLKDLDREFLYGCSRKSENGGRTITRMKPCPIGYFQLWNVESPMTWKWPLFDTFYSHAACYDMNFMEMWKVTKRKMLPFYVHHQGGYRNWFGEGNDHLVARLVKSNALRNRRQERDDEIGRRLPIPEFKLAFDLGIEDYDKVSIRKIVDAAARKGPFTVRVQFHEGKRTLLPADWIVKEINNLKEAR